TFKQPPTPPTLAQEWYSRHLMVNHETTPLPVEEVDFRNPIAPPKAETPEEAHRKVIFQKLDESMAELLTQHPGSKIEINYVTVEMNQAYGDILNVQVEVDVWDREDAGELKSAVKETLRTVM